MNNYRSDQDSTSWHLSGLGNTLQGLPMQPVQALLGRDCLSLACYLLCGIILLPRRLVWIETNQACDSGIPAASIIDQASTGVFPCSSQLDVTVQRIRNRLANINSFGKAAVRIVREQLLCALPLIIVDQDLGSTLDPRFDLSEALVLESYKHVGDDRMICLWVAAHVVHHTLEDAEHKLARFLVLVVSVQEVA